MQVYKTRGVCSPGNSVRTGRRHHQTRKLYRRMFRKHTGRCTPGRRHESKDAIARLEGIHCGPRPTSCPDQLAKALKEAINA